MSESTDEGEAKVQAQKLQKEKDFYQRVLAYVKGPQKSFASKFNPADLYVFRSSNCRHKCSCWKHVTTGFWDRYLKGLMLHFITHFFATLLKESDIGKRRTLSIKQILISVLPRVNLRQALFSGLFVASVCAVYKALTCILRYIMAEKASGLISPASTFLSFWLVTPLTLSRMQRKFVLYFSLAVTLECLLKHVLFDSQSKPKNRFEESYIQVKDPSTGETINRFVPKHLREALQR